MKAKSRRPANFVIEEFSSVFKRKVAWHVEVSGSGATARRDVDGRSVRIGWRELISAALFYGAGERKVGI